MDKLKVFRKISTLERCFVANGEQDVKEQVRSNRKLLLFIIKVLNGKILITVKMTEMTTKRKEVIVKVAKTSRLTEPEYSSVGNMLLLAVCHTRLQFFYHFLR